MAATLFDLQQEVAGLAGVFKAETDAKAALDTVKQTIAKATEDEKRATAALALATEHRVNAVLVVKEIFDELIK